MKLEKAIEILQNELNHGFRCGCEDLNIAQELGIEAMKRLKENRKEHIDISYRALPGETGEE